MERELNFLDMTRLVGAAVLKCDEKGYSQGEYVVAEYAMEHDRISVSCRETNAVTTLWPEDFADWHFRFPGIETKTSEKKKCPLKFGFCIRNCAWFDEESGFCAVFK